MTTPPPAGEGSREIKLTAPMSDDARQLIARAWSARQTWRSAFRPPPDDAIRWRIHHRAWGELLRSLPMYETHDTDGTPKLFGVRVELADDLDPSALEWVVSA